MNVELKQPLRTQANRLSIVDCDIHPNSPDTDLLPYLSNNVFPDCPAGGVYSINRVDQVPTCSIPSHALTAAH